MPYWYESADERAHYGAHGRIERSVDTYARKLLTAPPWSVVRALQEEALNVERERDLFPESVYPKPQSKPEDWPDIEPVEPGQQMSLFL